MLNVLKEKASKEKERQKEPKREQQSVSDIQMDNHHAEEAFGFALADPLAIYPSIAIPQNFPQDFPQTLDSGCGIWSPYNAILAENQAMLQINTVSVDSLQQQQQQQNMQSSVMQNQIPLINFQPSSLIISENPYLVTQNDNFGRNIDHRSIQ
ncbi:hypothetical protein V8G54_024264 [Vigna mungo]|uniref:Uncharacterized protein n=1 Tax=Vigna mungo TaxID=3915 RepID=A0AAQ3N5A1_VIGMU